MALCQWLQKLTHAVMFFSPAKVSVDDRPLKQVYVNQNHVQIIPYLNHVWLRVSCWAWCPLSLFDTSKNEILGEVVQLFCQCLNISLVQGQGILNPTNTETLPYVSLDSTEAVAFLLPQLLSYHGKGQASLRCEWNWCPSNPSHTGFNFSGAESFCASFKLLSSRWEDKWPFFFHVKW